jgi:hypothetical protein
LIAVGTMILIYFWQRVRKGRRTHGDSQKTLS